MPDVDFIIDIGGQDMKCFKIEDGAISNIFLNEACSSGCGLSLIHISGGAVQHILNALICVPEHFRVGIGFVNQIITVVHAVAFRQVYQKHLISRYV